MASIQSGSRPAVIVHVDRLQPALSTDNPHSHGNTQAFHQNQSNLRGPEPGGGAPLAFLSLLDEPARTDPLAPYLASSLAGRPEPETKGGTTTWSPDETAPLLPRAAKPTSEETIKFIESLGISGLTKEQLSEIQLPTFDAATCSDQTRGILKGGAAAYGSSFMIGKLLINYLALAGTEAGIAGVAMFPIAGLLNAVVSEPLAGALRANEGSYASPDGANSANYHTANARLLAAWISGDKKEIDQCRKDLKTIVDSAIERAKGAAGSSSKLCCALEKHPIIGATIRSWLTDDLPFASFIAMYLAPGGTAAMLRESLDDKTAFAALDALSFAAAGATAGILTVLGQNVGRMCLQKAPAPRQGIETEFVRDRHADQAKEMSTLLERNVGALQEHRRSLEAAIKAAKAGPNPKEDPKAKELLNRTVHLINELSLKKIEQDKKIESLQTRSGRTWLTAKKTFDGAVLGKPVNPAAVAFLDGGPMQRRTCAKVTGNAVALMAMTAYMLFHVMPLAAQAAELMDPENSTEFNSTPFNSTQFDAMQDADKFPDLLYGLTNACVLIGGWLLRSAASTTTEYAAAIGEGLRRRVFSSTPDASAQAEPQPAMTASNDIEMGENKSGGMPISATTATSSSSSSSSSSSLRSPSSASVSGNESLEDDMVTWRAEAGVEALGDEISAFFNQYEAALQPPEDAYPLPITQMQEQLDAQARPSISSSGNSQGESESDDPDGYDRHMPP